MSDYIVVVDMQNDFVGGALGSDAARAIVPAAARLIAQRLREGWRVVYTMDTHGRDYLTTHEGKLLPVPHCVHGTPGWQLCPEIAAACPPERATVFEKHAFGSRELAGALAEGFMADAGRVELAGLCTDICVVSNALILRAFLTEADIAVRADCCAGTSEQNHRSALETMRSCHIRVE